MKKVTLHVSGMHCDGCAERLSKLLGQAHGVRDATVSYSRSSAEIAFNAAVTSEEKLRTLVTTAGFTAEKD